MNYPQWLDRFNFPTDIDKADLSNMTRALLWCGGQIIDAITAEDLSGFIKTIDGKYLWTTANKYVKWAQDITPERDT